MMNAVLSVKKLILKRVEEILRSEIEFWDISYTMNIDHSG